MASPIESTWSHTTVLIETPHGGRGTGFLVGRPIGPDRWKIYLVTNKHVLDIDPVVRASLNHVDLHINVTKAGKVVGEKVRFGLRDTVLLFGVSTLIQPLMYSLYP